MIFLICVSTFNVSIKIQKKKKYKKIVWNSRIFRTKQMVHITKQHEIS